MRVMRLPEIEGAGWIEMRVSPVEGDVAGVMERIARECYQFVAEVGDMNGSEGIEVVALVRPYPITKTEFSQAARAVATALAPHLPAGARCYPVGDMAHRELTRSAERLQYMPPPDGGEPTGYGDKGLFAQEE